MNYQARFSFTMEGKVALRVLRRMEKFIKAFLHIRVEQRNIRRFLLNVEFLTEIAIARFLEYSLLHDVTFRNTYRPGTDLQKANN